MPSGGDQEAQQRRDKEDGARGAQGAGAEARAAGVQDGFVFCFEARGPDGACPAPKSANDIDDVLQAETDLAKRLQAWEASKAVGAPPTASGSAHRAAPFTFNRAACSSGSVYPLGCSSPLNTRSSAAW